MPTVTNMTVLRRECSGYICKFNLVSDQKEQHPLHLKVCIDLFHLLVGETEHSSSVIAIERCDKSRDESKLRTGSDRLFAIVEKTDMGFASNGTCSGRDLSNAYQTAASRVSSNMMGTVDQTITQLHCSERFLTHYKFSTTDSVIVRPVKVFPLERVVVAVTSPRALKWTHNTFFTTGLLLSVCQHTVLARQDDVLLAPHNVLFSHDDTFDMGIFFDTKVLYCEPMNQGRLTVNTEVVVINQTDQEEHTVTLYDQSNLSECERWTSKNGLMAGEERCQPLILSDFAVGSRSIESEFIQPILAETLIPSLQGTERSPDVQNSVKLLEPVVVLSLEKMCSMLGIHTKGFTGDIFNTVGLSRKTMCDIGLFDGSLAEVELLWKVNPTQQHTQIVKGQDCTKSKTRRTVMVHVANGENVRDGQVYLPPGLCFNICRKALFYYSSSSATSKLVLKKSPLSEKKLDLGAGDESSTSWSWRGSVPYAAEVHLSIVNSPNYSASADTTELLKQYFTIPRLLKKGDVIAMSSYLDTDYCGVDTYDGIVPQHPVIYFRVARIHPALPTIHTYWVDTKHSVLFQDGAVNSYIPASTKMVPGGDEVLPPPGMSHQFSELFDTIRSHLYHGRRDEDPVPSVLLTGQAGCGKTLLTKAVAAALHLHLYQVNAHELCGDTSASTEARVKAMMTRATMYAPCILHLKNVQVFGKAADGNTEEPRTASAFHEIVRKQLIDHSKWPVVMVASTSHVQQVNLDLYEGFLHQQTIQVPNEFDRQEMLTGILKPLSSIGKINLARVAQRTAGFVLGDLYTLIGQANRHAQTRLFKYCSAGRQTGLSCMEEEDLLLAGVKVTQADIEAALDNLQSAHSDSIGAPKIPQVSWDDVGGLVAVKAEILDTIQLPLQHPELLAAGLKRSGVLLYGPPGTGKTLLAKAVATECSLNFLSVKGPELINMYVGQSEENIREVFQRARSAAPCVIFFDELDSLAPNRGRSGDSGGVMDRVVSQLLAELDGMNKSADVFVIGATNRPDLLDPALLRPGRFDKLLYLGVSEDRANQLNILKALTRKFVLSPGWTLHKVVEQCPLNMTGADFYALCSDAMLNALKRKIALLSEGVDVDQSRVEVEEDDFRDALATLVPSVSMAELARYQSLQHSFSR